MAPLTRIHSILKHSVSMRDADIDMIVSTIDAILTDLSKQPQLQPCVLPDGWIPIASLLNYTHLGQSVWPFGGVGVVADCLAARNSAVSELSSDSACVRNKPLRVRLRQQLEYIFSDVNYHKDIHLHLLAEPDGYTPMHLLFSTYSQLQQLMQQVQAPSPAALEALQQAVVREALETSSELVVRPPQPGGASPFGAARRKTLPERVMQQVEWYLSGNKIVTDRFLAELSKDHDGWVPIASLLSFPRMRKLCHPQIAAVAHVLSSSSKVDVSDDQTLVRPRGAPHSSPAGGAGGAGGVDGTGGRAAALLAALERLLSDASLCFDAALQRSIVEHSPAASLKRGGVGLRLPIEHVLGHPAVAELAREAPGGRAELLAGLPRRGATHHTASSAVLQLSEDEQFVERLTPTPEVRQLVSASARGRHQGSWSGGVVAGVGGAVSGASSDAAEAAAAADAGGQPPQPPQPPPPPPPPSSSSSSDFSVMTFNLLADMLCTCEMYPAVATEVLSWKNRRDLIERELAFHSPDILCLQELQGATEGAGVPAEDDHHAHLKAWLTQRGYDGRYVRKTRRYGGSWPLQIGNALFWRREAFEYVEHEEVHLAALLAAACDEEVSSAHFGREPQVGLCVALRHRATGRHVVAVTTHLSSHFQEPWRQVAQAHCVVSAGNALAAKLGGGGGGGGGGDDAAAVVFGGDLNSIPGSGVYQLINNGRLAPSHPHVQLPAHEELTMPSFGELGGGSGGELRLQQPLASAYAVTLGQEPLFTNFAGPPSNFIGTLDYLFFSHRQLTVTHVLQLPTEDTVRVERFLPSSRFPSDHLPLLAHFAFGGSLSPHSFPLGAPPPRQHAASSLSTIGSSDAESPSNSPPMPRAAPSRSSGSCGSCGSPLSAAAPAFTLAPGAGVAGVALPPAAMQSAGAAGGGGVAGPSMLPPGIPPHLQQHQQQQQPTPPPPPMMMHPLQMAPHQAPHLTSGDSLGEGSPKRPREPPSSAAADGSIYSSEQDVRGDHGGRGRGAAGGGGGRGRGRGRRRRG